VSYPPHLKYKDSDAHVLQFEVPQSHIPGEGRPSLTAAPLLAYSEGLMHLVAKETEGHVTVGQLYLELLGGVQVFKDICECSRLPTRHSQGFQLL
jgi:hypothetical protein